MVIAGYSAAQPLEGGNRAGHRYGIAAGRPGTKALYTELLVRN